MPNLSAFSPRALAVLRIMAGLLFMEHGTRKFFAFPVPFPMQAPLPTLFMIAGTIELIGGALIALGLFTRFAAFIACGEMAAAYFIQHAPKGFWPIGNMGDAAVLFCFVFLYLAAAGAGAWSVDGARTRNAPIR